MLINKDLSMIMRSGKYAVNVRKQNDSGLIVCACILLGMGLIVLCVGIIK